MLDRWAPTIGMSMLNLRATRNGFGTVGGTSNTGGVPLKSLRKDVDDVIECVVSKFFWMDGQLREPTTAPVSSA